MKTFRNLLVAFAFIFAIGGAIAGQVFAPIDAFYKISSTVCSQDTELTNESNCNASLTSGIQCTVSVTGNPVAFKTSACTTPLYRPN